MPNLNDIAEWLKDRNGTPAEMRIYGDEFRAVKIQKHVLAFPCSHTSNPFYFENNLNYKLFDVVCNYSNGKPSLIFCSTRKSTVAACEQLSLDCKNGNTNRFVVSKLLAVELQQSRMSISDKKLGEFIELGLAYHHGGTCIEDRQIIEGLFLKGKLAVIATTSTLAVGINLPAHLVIIKGTQQYIAGKNKNYSNMDMLQMIGRAGRPQFDNYGVAVVLTTVDHKEECENMILGREIVESSLHLNLIEHLNAEVVLGTIKSVKDAMNWLRSTFLYVRIKKNPAHYKLKNCSKEQSILSAETRLEAIFMTDIDQLDENQIVTRNDMGHISTSGFNFH